MLEIENGLMVNKSFKGDKENVKIQGLTPKSTDNQFVSTRSERE